MSERAVSEVVSYVLVFGLIVSAVGIVSVSGLDTLQDRRDAEQMNNAERAFNVLADNVADIHRRGAPSRATEINLGRAELTTGDNVTMEVAVDDGSGFSTVVDRRIRPVIYAGEQDRELVYEAGAVFRTNRDGGVIVQAPPFVVDDDRVVLPVIGLNSPTAQTLGGSTVLVRTREQATALSYNDTESDTREVRVRITDSDQQTLWRQYFENRGFACSTPSTDTLQCDFPDSASNVDRVFVVDYDILVSIDP